MSQQGGATVPNPLRGASAGVNGGDEIWTSPYSRSEFGHVCSWCVAGEIWALRGVSGGVNGGDEIWTSSYFSSEFGHVCSWCVAGETAAHIGRGLISDAGPILQDCRALSGAGAAERHKSG